MDGQVCSYNDRRSFQTRRSPRQSHHREISAAPLNTSRGNKRVTSDDCQRWERGWSDRKRKSGEHQRFETTIFLTVGRNHPLEGEGISHICFISYTADLSGGTE